MDSKSDDSRPGRLKILSGGGKGGAPLDYHLYVPPTGGVGAPIFVPVHGLSGNAAAYARTFAPLADRAGAVLVAPRFRLPVFRDYQRLGRTHRGERADLALERILEEDIQPYVARDGGEITFAGFQNGVVEVYLQGACSGCPSSAITLKMGIEARLKEEIPEVVEVVAL